MPEFLTIILAIALIGGGLLIILRCSLLWLQCRHLRLQEPYYALAAGREVPQDITAYFESFGRELVALGFRVCGMLQVEPMEQNDFLHPWERLYIHPETATYAKANLRAVLEPSYGFDVEFYSYFEDGSWLITTNGKAHSYLIPFPQVRLQDSYTASYAQQWDEHLQKLTALQQICEVRSLATTNFLLHLTQLGQDYLAAATAGDFLKVQMGCYSLSKVGVKRSVEQYLRVERKLKVMAIQRRKWVQQGKMTSIPLPAELEIRVFRAMERMQAQLSRGWKMPWVIAGSLGLFLVSFAHQFAFDWRMLFNFTLTLSLHEAGHLLAMHLFGYQNTSVLFLPFLGAVASAQKEDASLPQKIGVLLAGPLPGLLLGVGLLTIAPTTPWTTDLAWMLIGLNGFNLLPIYPLDGGQIAQLLIFSGYPYGDVCFKLFAIVGLGTLAIQTPVLWVLVLLVGRSIPTGFRIAKVTTGLQTLWRTQHPLQRQEKLHSVFSELQSQGLSHLPLTQRYLLVKALLERQQDITASWKQRVTLSLVYVITLLGGLWGIVQTVMPLGMDLRATASEEPVLTLEQRYTQRLAIQERAIQANPRPVEPYLKRADLYFSLQQSERAIAECTRAIQIAPRSTEAYRRRGGFHHTLGNFENAIADYQTALKLQPKDIVAQKVLGELFQKQGNLQHSLYHYDRLLTQDAKDLWAYLARGEVRLGLGDARGAIADANAALQFHAELSDAYWLRSKSREKLGDRAGAVVDRQTALQLASSKIR
jgi:tetratricopeptide (TPR) repeat protein/Zn-dependent protease